MYIEETPRGYIIVLQEEMEENSDPIAIEIPNARGHDTKALALFVMRAMECHNSLVEACEEVLSYIAYSSGDGEVQSQLRAAIAKAGREHTP